MMMSVGNEYLINKHEMRSLFANIPLGITSLMWIKFSGMSCKYFLKWLSVLYLF